MPVDVSLTLRVNVTGDCPSQWRDSLLGGKKASGNITSEKKIQRETSFSRSSIKTWGQLSSCQDWLNL